MDTIETRRAVIELATKQRYAGVSTQAGNDLLLREAPDARGLVDILVDGEFEARPGIRPADRAAARRRPRSGHGVLELLEQACARQGRRRHLRDGGALSRRRFATSAPAQTEVQDPRDGSLRARRRQVASLPTYEDVVEARAHFSRPCGQRHVERVHKVWLTRKNAVREVRDALRHVFAEIDNGRRGRSVGASRGRSVGASRGRSVGASRGFRLVVRGPRRGAAYGDTRRRGSSGELEALLLTRRRGSSGELLLVRRRGVGRHLDASGGGGARAQIRAAARGPCDRARLRRGLRARATVARFGRATECARRSLNFSACLTCFTQSRLLCPSRTHRKTLPRVRWAAYVWATADEILSLVTCTGGICE